MNKIKGRKIVIENFYMPQLDRYRTLRIYLPPEYDESKRRYPVIYMQDAQNLFDVNESSFGTIWDVANVLDELYSNDNNKAFIVVGIDNGCNLRYSEYSPWYSEIGGEYLPHAKATGLPGGEGFRYIDFLATTLKEYIDNNYRTLKNREHTAICGSSMGGLISLCAAVKYQGIYSKLGVFSSAFYFCEDKVSDFIITAGKKESIKIYMDVGTNETSNHDNTDFPSVYVNCNKRIYNELKYIGFSDKELIFEIAEGGTHCETCWKERYPQMINWLFG